MRNDQDAPGEAGMIPLLAEIERILLHEWDPIGVRGTPEAADEYDGYAFQLYVMLQAPAPPSAGEIAAYLGRVQNERMALAPTVAHNRAVAARIAGLA